MSWMKYLPNMRKLRLGSLLMAGVMLASSAARSPAQEESQPAPLTPSIYGSQAEARAALAQALAEERQAAARAEKLDAAASAATEQTLRTQQQSAALAARVQQSQAAIAAGNARIAIINQLRRDQQLRLAQQQQPLIDLIASLQMMTRRPVALSIIQPGSVQDMVHMRAMLNGILPEIRSRTAALRAEIERARKLRAQSLGANAKLAQEYADLNQRRAKLAVIESRQQLVARQVSGAASFEEDRAIALREQARDITGLMASMEASGARYQALAELPGPVLRAESSEQADQYASSSRRSGSSSPAYMLPVQGRLLVGVGEISKSGVRSRGVTLAAKTGAAVVAPAPGKVVYAAPYRGFGGIVIIEHEGGWSSLITGLGRIDTTQGATVSQGSVLGNVAPNVQGVTVELRRSGRPIDIMSVIGAG